MGHGAKEKIQETREYLKDRSGDIEKIDRERAKQADKKGKVGR
jgi:hypothetical protein